MIPRDTEGEPLQQAWESSEDVGDMLDLLWERHAADEGRLRLLVREVYLDSCEAIAPLLPHPDSQLAVKLAVHALRGEGPLELDPTQALEVEWHQKASADDPPEPGAQAFPDPQGAELALAHWFSERAAFAFDYGQRDPQVADLIAGFAPSDELRALLNPRHELPNDARLLLCAAAYFVDLTVTFMGVVVAGGGRPGRPLQERGIDSDLFLTPERLRRRVPDPSALA